MDIIIFGGQSNMQGQSERLTGTTPIPNAGEYKFLTDEIVPLKNPVGEDIRYDHTPGYPPTQETDLAKWLEDHVVGSACYGHTNLVPEFCNAYVQTTQHKVLAVPAAKGSTVIADWMPGTPGYDILVKKSCAAITKARAQEPVERIFFAWLQGESDAIFDSKKAYYKEKIAELCTALQKDIGIEKFGIIRVGRFTHDAKDFEIIEAQDEICTENENFLMLTTIATELNTQPEYMHPDIWGHFGAKGLEKLGQEAGKTLGAWVNSSPSN